MSTVREQIVAACVTALNTAAPGGVPAFTRERSTGIEETEALAGAVYPTRESPQELSSDGPLVRVQLYLNVVIWARATALLRPSQAVDPGVAWVIKTLCNNRLNGLAIDIQRGELIFDYESGESPWCRATQELVIDYKHLAADAESTG